MESPIVTAILNWFNFYPRYGFVWRSNTGGVWDASRGLYLKARGAGRRKGIPDITGVLADGRFLGIEVKDKGKLSKDQLDIKQQIEKRGGVYIVARSVGDVDASIKGLIGVRE